MIINDLLALMSGDLLPFTVLDDEIREEKRVIETECGEEQAMQTRTEHLLGLAYRPRQCRP